MDKRIYDFTVGKFTKITVRRPQIIVDFLSKAVGCFLRTQPRSTANFRTAFCDLLDVTINEYFHLVVDSLVGVKPETSLERYVKKVDRRLKGKILTNIKDHSLKKGLEFATHKPDLGIKILVFLIIDELKNKQHIPWPEMFKFCSDIREIMIIE